MTHSPAVAQPNVAPAVPAQRAIPLDSPREWKRALFGVPHSFFHTWEHSYAMHLTHKQPAYLYCAEAEGVRVVCPFIERPIGEYVDIATPYGYSGFAGNGDIRAFPSHWEHFVKSRGYVSAFIALHPHFFRFGCTRAEETHELKSLYFLDLSLETEELLRRCSKTRRQSIRKAESVGISIVTDRQRLTRFVLDNYRDFFRRKNANASYGFRSTTIQYLMSLDCALAIGAASGDQIEAVHLTVCTPHVAEYLFCFDRRAAESHGIGLIWEAVKRLRGLGIERFSLGGGLEDRDSLDAFKRRFGGERRTLRALKQVIQPETYARLCAGVGADPDDRAGYFPAYRASHTDVSTRRTAP